MNRILIFIVVVFECVLFAEAQNKTTLVQRINEIKAQNDVYFWDQATYPEADSAKIVATKRLLIGVNIDRSENAQLSVEEIVPHTSYISIDRGNLKQIFAYIKKSDAAAVQTGAASSVLIGEPINTMATTPTANRSFVPDAFVQRIMETKDFRNVYKLLKSLQVQGQVLQFGKLKDVDDYSALDLILFDMQSQEIITMLSPVTTSGYRKNVVDGTDDSLENYPSSMTAVIWYIKK